MHAKKLIQATCEEGKGCTFEISELDASEYDVITGKPEGYHENLPENAIFVNTKLNGSWEQYVETGMTRSQLDQFYGGDGFTMIYPFNPYFQPVDGQWQIKIGTVTGDICYRQESNIFKSMLQGMNQSGNITFPKPFHARFLMNNPKLKVLGLANHVSELVPKITKEKFQYEQIPQSKLNKNFILKNIE